MAGHNFTFANADGTAGSCFRAAHQRRPLGSTTVTYTGDGLRNRSSGFDRVALGDELTADTRSVGLEGVLEGVSPSWQSAVG